MVSEKKSIIDFLLREIDPTKEIHKLAELFEDEFKGEFEWFPSIEERIDEDGSFLEWSHRGTYLSTSELKNAMGIEDIRGKELDEEKIIFYLEYILNMLSISNTEYHREYDIIVRVLYENIEIILSQLNLEKYEVKKCLYRIIPKNAEVCEAFKVVDTSIKRQILEYNHITIRENIAAKRNILLNLYNNFEPKLGELKKTPEGKNIASDLGFLLNNLNIRHNNVEGEKVNNAIINMSKQEMCEWYDKCYHIYITAVLIYEYITKHKAAIKELKPDSQRSAKF